jgi:hypothetical protein
MDRRKPSTAEKAAIGAAWAWFVRNRDRVDIPFVEVVTRVQALCPSASVEHIRLGFERRLRRVQRLV